MDICIMEISAFLFFVILIPLTASETETRNIGVFLYSIFVRFVRYILYGQELHVKELKKLVPDENRDSILQRENLYEISPKDTLDNGLQIQKTSTLPIQDLPSTKNLHTKDTPSTGFVITSCSTEIDDTYSFLQDASSETSKDLTELIQEPELSLDSFTKENGKGFEIPVAVTGLSESELQNHSVMLEIPVGTHPICAMAGNASDGKIFTFPKSEEVVQFSLDDLKTSVPAISTCPCPVAARTNDLSLLVGANLTGLVDVFQAWDIKRKLSVEVRYPAKNASSKYIIPAFIAEDASDNDCVTGNAMEEMEIDEISPLKRSALSVVPMEFLYPCLPYFIP